MSFSAECGQRKDLLILRLCVCALFRRRSGYAGYEIKRGKNISLKGKGQKRFIRLCSLGDGYSEEDLRVVLAGTKEHQPRKRARGVKEKSFADTKPKLQLLIDIQEKMEQGKSAGYAR
ncbi:MAG: hypothetical protein LUG99_20360 [Lachnospiraceae bacterium]|nr:hypothetical protein [Lachnospiraceae bacterium]